MNEMFHLLKKNTISKKNSPLYMNEMCHLLKNYNK